MAKQKKLGLKFEKSKDVIRVRVTYNGTNTKLKAPFVIWGPIVRTESGFNSRANDLEYVKKNDTPLFLKVKEVYDFFNLTYEATDFTYNSDRFRFLCSDAHSTLEKFLGVKVSEHLYKIGFPSTSVYIQNEITIPLYDDDMSISMVKELNPHVYKEIVNLIKEYEGLTRYLELRPKKSQWVYNPVASIICPEDSEKPTYWENFRNFVIETFNSGLSSSEYY